MNLPRVLVRAPLAVAMLLLFSAFISGAEAQTAAGSVIGAAGQTTVRRGGQLVPLTIGAPVFVGDSVQVPADGKLKLRMSDGSILALAPASNMRIDTYVVDPSGRRQAAGLSVGQGLLRAVTAPVDRPASFEIDTAAGSAAVRSTDWFVNMIAGFEQVSVISGSVSLASRATGRAVTIPAGMGSRLYAGRDPEPPHPISPAEFAGLIARTEGGGVPPAPPPAGGYYPPPGVFPPGGVIVVPGGGRGGGDRGGGDRGGRGGREPGQPGGSVPSQPSGPLSPR